MGSLAQPPNFQAPGAKNSPGPSTLADWVSFYRWLVSLWRVASTSITAPQSITLQAKTARSNDQNTLGAAEAFREGRPSPVGMASPDAAAIAGYSPPPRPVVFDELTGALLASASVPRQQLCDELKAFALPQQAQPVRLSDDVSGLLQYVLSKPPYPVNATSQAWVLVNTHAFRSSSYPAATYPDGTLFWETDRTVLYVDVAGQWVYAAGTMAATQATLPADLGAYDAGFLAGVTDYNHSLEWSGSGWGWAPGDNGSGYVQGFLVDPTGAGWQVCDGSAVAVLNQDGTTSSVTTPAIVGGDAAFLQFGSPASATINAAVAPLLVMDPYTPAGTNDAPIFTGDDFTPAGTVAAPTFSGTPGTPAGTVASTFSGSALATHQHEQTVAAVGGVHLYMADSPFGTGGSVIDNAIAGVSAAGNTINSHLVSATSAGTPAGTVASTFSGASLTPAGTNSAPAFTGTPAAPTGTNSAPNFTGAPDVPTGTIDTTGAPANIVLKPWLRR